jgi:hypothetical protein
MAVNEDLTERVCFMLNGNMVAGTSKRGLLIRVGKEQYASAVTWPDARPMEMSGRRGSCPTGG